GVEKSLEIVRTVKTRYPDLRIFARACSRNHAYELLDAGVEHVYQETLDSSLELSVEALRTLGVRGYRARRASRRFRRKEEQDLRELNAMRHDRQAYISLARERIRQIEAVMKKDLDERPQPSDDAWDLAAAIRRMESQRAETDNEDHPEQQPTR
ncbi:MAG: potassium transporter, partial [Planctomycetes bacterium]|nr:potassium transporter [Planctomycetota bacterium]